MNNCDVILIILIIRGQEGRTGREGGGEEVVFKLMSLCTHVGEYKVGDARGDSGVDNSSCS